MGKVKVDFELPHPLLADTNHGNHKIHYEDLGTPQW